MAQQSSTSSQIIVRTAVDNLGFLGASYDAHHDRVLPIPCTIPKQLSERLFQISNCTLEKCSINSRKKILSLIDVDEQTRLSILLNFTQKSGVALAIDYPYRLNEFTRILHYRYIHCTEYISDQDEITGKYKFDSTATHFITSITWGIDLIVVLKLPCNHNTATAIDNMLEKHKKYLNGEENSLQLTQEDVDSYEKIIDTKIYSNIQSLTESIGLQDLFHVITHFKVDDIQHQRLEYTLSPIPNRSYVIIDSSAISYIEECLYEFLDSMEKIEKYFDEDMTSLLHEHFKDRLSNCYDQWLNMKPVYSDLTKRFRKLVHNTRSNSIKLSTMHKKLQSKKLNKIRICLFKLTNDVNDLNEKAHLIDDLIQQNIKYCDVNRLGINKNDNLDTLKHRLNFDANVDRIICSSDYLNMNNPNNLKNLLAALLNEYEKNAQLRLIYADFSYSNCQLDEMTILPSSRMSPNEEHHYFESIHLNSSQLVFSKLNDTYSSSPTEIINILLLGETGVGKSTFINAFVNYLVYKTFDNALSDKPMAVIPVSFVLTVGHNLDERVINFQDESHSKNENFNHVGHSVTQQCRSYIINLKNSIGKRIRIIDTPGFGDTRGLDQDDINMKNILEYIKKIRHLNAVCFLFKPNESKLNVFYRSCLVQLFDFLGPELRNNIVFCFTNSRSSFYSPGNIAPILKDMLSSLSIGKIQFKKRNTFCFDSESFRYLVALQNDIPFDDEEKSEYRTSWINSTRESNRFIHFICKHLEPYLVPDENEATKRAQVEIVQFIHPILETMRDILRTVIIRKTNSLKAIIKLTANDLIVDENSCDICLYEKPPVQPATIDFLQEYKILNDPSSSRQDASIEQLSLLSYISAEFGHFLYYIAHYDSQDPFLIGLLRMIKEENEICEAINRNYVNLQLVQGLYNLLRHYEHLIDYIKSMSQPRKLSDIYQWINYVETCSLISKYVIINNNIYKTDDNNVSRM